MTESLTDIERDLLQAFEQAMMGDYKSTTHTSAKLTVQHFMRRIEAFTQYFAYQEARRLTNHYSESENEK